MPASSGGLKMGWPDGYHTAPVPTKASGTLSQLPRLKSHQIYKIYENF
jgi:hypothetical protein